MWEENNMRDQHTDLRVVRTKESIRDALVDLIEEKGFDSLTVKDITTKARINRGTFYTHYEDKYDLMTKCQEEMMKGIAKIVKQNFPDVLVQLESNSQTIIPFSIAVSIFEFLNENSRFMKAVIGEKGDLSFQTKLKEYIWKTLFEEHSTAILKEENLLVPGRYLASYISSAHIGVVQQWLESGRKESPQEMARILSTLTINGPFFAAGIKK